MPFKASGNLVPSFCEGEGEGRGGGGREGEGKKEKRGSRDDFSLQVPGLSVHSQ